MGNDKGQRLVRISGLMQQAMPLLLASDRLKAQGQIPEAEAVFNQLAASLTAQLEETLEHDRLYPDTAFGTGPVVSQLLNALLTQADLVETLGRPDQAEALRNRAMSLSDAHQTSPDIAERRRQRAASLLAQARYHEATIALNEARDEFARREMPLETAQVAVDLAELYEWLGDFERALEEAGRTRLLIEPLIGDRTPSFADAFNAFAAGRPAQAESTAKLSAVWLDLAQVEARVARSLGNFDLADTLFRRVRKEIQLFVAPAIDFQIARNEIERGHVAEGLASLRDIEPKMSGLLRPKLGAILGWKAEALLRLGRPNEAIPLARASVAELTQYRDLDSLWKAQWREGKALIGAGDRPAALAAFDAAVTTVTTLRRFPMGYRLESTFFADKLPLFDDAIFLAAELGDAPTCARLIEQVKSRALTSMLTVAPIEGQTKGDLDAAVDELSRQVDVLEYRAYQKGWDAETTAARDRLLTERTRLLERILVSDPRWRTLSRPTEPDLTRVAASLARANQAALSLYYRSGRVVGLLIYRGAAQVAVKSLSEETVAAISDYHQNLASTTPDRRAFDPITWPGLAADRLVPADLLNQALGAAGLVVIPHGPLHLLPWSALTVGGARLFERSAVGVLPNMSCLVILEPATAGPPSIALLGAPTYQGLAGLSELPLAAEELFTVAEIFGDRVVGVPRTGADATQDAYRELLADPKGAHGILHLACHGDLVAGDPENSGLLLHDGKLDASDIARRKIPFDEVVLSACASGYRPTRVGGVELSADDIVGLPGAFLEAGARCVLVSIPPARDDAALAFMTLYYEHRVLGEPPLRSFRAAELAMLAAGEYPAYLWAGFTLYGR